MIKTFDDIIKIDTKWLIHFLKENHIKKEYFNKMLPLKKFPSYNDWIKFIFNNKVLYTRYIKYIVENIDEAKLNDNNIKRILSENPFLISSPGLFAVWQELPFTLITTDNVFDLSLEYKAWKNIRDKFINTKFIITKIMI